MSFCLGWALWDVSVGRMSLSISVSLLFPFSLSSILYLSLFSPLSSLSLSLSFILSTLSFSLSLRLSLKQQLHVIFYSCMSPLNAPEGTPDRITAPHRGLRQHADVHKCCFSRPSFWVAHWGSVWWEVSKTVAFSLSLSLHSTLVLLLLSCIRLVCLIDRPCVLLHL